MAPAVGAAAVGGVTQMRRNTADLLHGWGPGVQIEIPMPVPFAELAPAFSDSISAPEIGQGDLDNDESFDDSSIAAPGN